MWVLMFGFSQTGILSLLDYHGVLRPAAVRYADLNNLVVRRFPCRRTMPTLEGSILRLEGILFRDVSELRDIGAFELLILG